MKLRVGSIELELEEIKEYQKFTLYQVYKIIGKEKISLYKTCYTKFQLQQLREQGEY